VVWSKDTLNDYDIQTSILSNPNVIMPSQWTARCRGGPYHGKIMTRNDRSFPVEKHQKAFMGYPGQLPPVQDFEYHYYILIENPESMKTEWIWQPLLKKLRKRWDKRKEIESIMRRFYVRFTMDGDFEARKDVQRVLELVYKL
jgi:hypothetical protein